MRTAVALLYLLLLQPLAAQEWTTSSVDVLLTRLEESAEKYKALDHYEARATLMVFSRATDKLPSERGSSHVWKVGQKAKAEHLGMVSFQNDVLRVTIDPEDRIMVLGEPEEYVGLMGVAERRALLGMATGIHSLTELEGISYKVRFPKGSEYDHVVFFFDMSGWLRRMETQWGREVPLVPDNPLTGVILPKVVMELEPPRRIAPTSVKADPSEAVAFVDGQPIPTAAYKGFTVIDNRLRP